MVRKICYIILLLFTTINAQSKDYYTGAVVEYAPKYNETQTPGPNIQSNIDEYVKYIKQAKRADADIIVFPEYGLTTTSFKLSDINLYTTVLPDPKKKIVVCGMNETWSKVIERLSCAARDNSIYLVVNLPERTMQDGDDKKSQIYNTNIVFDRTGALIARYRKYNLFIEPGFNITETPDLTYFETDFNVTFGTFICFDILFYQPSLQLLQDNPKITDIVYSTAWFSELPFLTAVQTQVGWARANGVNMLAAGYTDPKNTLGGSGIYQANGDISYNIPEKKESSLIVRQIKKRTQRIDPENNNGTASKTRNNANNSKLKFVTWPEDMSKYTTKLVTENVENYKLCHEEFCCLFSIKLMQTRIPNEADYYYRMIVYNGERRFRIFPHTVQICGLAACTNQSASSCGHQIEVSSNSQVFDEISIDGEFFDEGNSVIFPSIVLYDLGVLSPSNYTFKNKKTDCQRHIEVKTTTQVKDILGFGIYNVIKDYSIASKTISALIIAVIVICVVVVIGLIALLIYRRFKNGVYYRHPVTG